MDNFDVYQFVWQVSIEWTRNKAKVEEPRSQWQTLQIHLFWVRIKCLFLFLLDFYYLSLSNFLCLEILYNGQFLSELWFLKCLSDKCKVSIMLKYKVLKCYIKIKNGSRFDFTSDLTVHVCFSTRIKDYK